MNIKNILTNKNLIRTILILENLFIIILLSYIIFKNLKNFKEDFIFYFYTFDIFIIENINYLFLSLLSVGMVIFSHIFLWREIFALKNIKLTYFQSLSLFSFIHFKRLFSPLGPISPLINIDKNLKSSTITYSLYIYFIILGSIIFFISAFSLIYFYFLILIFLSFYLGFIFFKKINFDIKFSTYLKLLISSILNECFSFLAYYFSLMLFGIKINLLSTILIYLTWVIVSSLFPFLYGSGTSELITTILVYNLNYDGSLFGLAIIFYRLIITYLPLLGLIFYKISYPQFDFDK